jgi:transcription antitermination factor NusB
MEQTPRQIAREKAIICIYQNLLNDREKDEIDIYLNENEILVEYNQYYSFAKEIIETTITNREQYVKLISKYLKTGWTFERLSFLEKAVLLVGACELLDFDRDKRVVINESILFCKKYCDQDSYRFINGILTKII